MSREFTLYYRENCHLCEDMRLALVALAKQHNFHWKEMDIDRDPDLVKRYGIEIPVLALNDDVVCFHFFDESAILDALNQQQKMR